MVRKAAGKMSAFRPHMRSEYSRQWDMKPAHLTLGRMVSLPGYDRLSGAIDQSLPRGINLTFTWGLRPLRRTRTGRWSIVTFGDTNDIDFNACQACFQKTKLLRRGP